MPDREKVIKALECCVKGDCSGCYQEGPECGIDCRWGVMWDALALLREQKKPKRESKAMLPCKCGGTRREHWYSSAKGAGLRCKKCGFEVWGKDDTDVIRKWNEEINNLSREERL